MTSYKYLKTLIIVVLLLYVSVSIYSGCCCKNNSKCCCKGKQDSSAAGGNTSSEIPLIKKPKINNKKQNINILNDPNKSNTNSDNSIPTVKKSKKKPNKKGDNNNKTNEHSKETDKVECDNKPHENIEKNAIEKNNIKEEKNDAKIEEENNGKIEEGKEVIDNNKINNNIQNKKNINNENKINYNNLVGKTISKKKLDIQENKLKKNYKKDKVNKKNTKKNNNVNIHPKTETLKNELNKNAEKILKLIIYNKQFINRINNSIKEGESNSGYLIKKEFMDKIYQLESYKFINKCLNKINIDLFLSENQNENYDSIFQKVLKKFTKETINNINENSKEITIYANEHKAETTSLQLNNNNYSYIINNFIILDPNIYISFSDNSGYGLNDSFNYFYKSKKIFIPTDKDLSKNKMLMCKMNAQNIIELELIFNFFNPNSRDYCINQIKELGYDKYQGFLLFGENNIVSPVFDMNQNQIGNTYKYNQSINDYTKYNINFEIRKIFLLYLNELRLLRKKTNNNNNNKFRQYYIINKAWIQKYKIYYKYDKISQEMDQKKLIQIYLNNVLNNCENSNININDKLIALIIQQLPQNIIDEFNLSDKNFSSFKNEEMKTPNIAQINYNNGSNILFYSNDFELISGEIYEYLFGDFDKNVREYNSKAEKVECIFENNYIIIKFPNKNTEGKYLVEIGNLNPEKIFVPEFFILYDQLNYLCEHFENIINAGGFTTYFEEFNKVPYNTLDISGNNNIKYGIVIKKDINNNNNNNPNIVNNYKPQKQMQMINYDYQYQYKKLENINTIIAPKKTNPPLIPQITTNLKSMFLWAPRVGLDNIGATCYMNATLQCFGQIEEFALFFKLDDTVNQSIEKCNKENKKCLSSSFKILIDKIWPDEAMKIESKNRHFPPNEFRQKIADMNPLFVNNQANDSKDLVNFIIMTLHEELNQSVVNNNINSINNTSLNNNDNKDFVFKVFHDEYQRTFRSKISELFYAIQQTETKCLKCNRSQYNFQAYFFLVFPLEEVRKYIINQINEQNGVNNNNMMFNNNFINNNIQFNMNNNNFNFNNGMNNNFNNMNNMIMPMQMQLPMPNLGQNFNTGNMLMNNNNFNMFNNNNNLGMIPQCNIMPPMPNIFNQQMNNNNQNSPRLQKLNNNIVSIKDCFDYNKKIDVFTDSNQIYCNMCWQMANAYYTSSLTTAPKILILLLNRGVGIQFKIKLEFTTILDLTNYISEKNGNKNIKYKLIGVITHLGESGASGHFIAHCLSPIDDKWYTYNDATVNEIENFQNIIDLGMPYLLFYKRIEE